MSPFRISKSARDVFVEGSMEDVRADFQRLMAYCASDVAATRRLAAKVKSSRFPYSYLRL